jgi:hypothetical protein
MEAAIEPHTVSRSYRSQCWKEVRFISRDEVDEDALKFMKKIVATPEISQTWVCPLPMIIIPPINANYAT